jgi:hypothetical protein
MAGLGNLKEIKGVRGAIYRAGQTAFAMRAAANFAALQRETNGRKPPVTAVVVGRNDDYMSDFIHRLRATIAWNSRYLVDEIIFVEWNPPADRELLSPALAKEFARLRAYVVAPEIHQAISKNRHIPLLEFHAKNVGIRRAATDWIVATNADAVFGPDMMRKILQTELSDDVVWSAQRIDINWHEGRATPVGLFDLMRYKRIIPYHPLGTGEFAFAGRKLWERARGYDESLDRHRIGVDKRGVAQMISHGAKTERAGLVFHMAHPTSCTEVETKHQGEWASWEDDLPYENDPNWGMPQLQETEIAERVWSLK